MLKISHDRGVGLTLGRGLAAAVARGQARARGAAAERETLPGARRWLLGTALAPYWGSSSIGFVFVLLACGFNANYLSGHLVLGTENEDV